VFVGGDEKKPVLAMVAPVGGGNLNGITFAHSGVFG
jgi:hypothetical protein